MPGIRVYEKSSKNTPEKLILIIQGLSSSTQFFYEFGGFGEGFLIKRSNRNTLKLRQVGFVFLQHFPDHPLNFGK